MMRDVLENGFRKGENGFFRGFGGLKSAFFPGVALFSGRTAPV